MIAGADENLYDVSDDRLEDALVTTGDALLLAVAGKEITRIYHKLSLCTRNLSSVFQIRCDSNHPAVPYRMAKCL